MKVRIMMRVCSILLAASLVSVGSLPARAQDPGRSQEKEHAVTSSQIAGERMRRQCAKCLLRMLESRR